MNRRKFLTTTILTGISCGFGDPCTLFKVAGSRRETEPPVSVISTLHDEQVLVGPHDVEVDGGLMFVPGKGGSIAIIDVKNPENPQLVWSTCNPEDDVETVLILDQYLLVGSRDFFTIDITKPSQSRICERLQDPRINRINGMVLWDNYALYADKSGWIGAVDVSRPDKPTLIDALNTSERGKIVSPHDIARFKNYVIIVNQLDQSPVKVRTYRVADPDTGDLLPIEQWQPKGAVVDKRLNGANRVVVGGGYAFIANNKANTLATVDLHNLNKLTITDVRSLPNNPCGLELAGSVLFIGSGQTVYAFDVSHPQNLINLFSFKSPEAFPSGFAKNRDGEQKYTAIDGVLQPILANAHDLVYNQGSLFVTAQSDDQVAILRINNPEIRNLAKQPLTVYKTNIGGMAKRSLIHT